MQGSFEKKVQEKMDSLKLTPSAPVWEKIELQLKPDKKRRRPAMWFPFLIIFLLGTALWLWKAGSEKDETLPTATTSPSVTPATPPPSTNTTPLRQEQGSTKTIVLSKKKREQPVTNKSTSRRLPTSLSKNEKTPIRNGQINNVVLTEKQKDADIRKDHEIGSANDRTKATSVEKLLKEKMPNGAIVENKTKVDHATIAENEKTLPVDSIEQNKAEQKDSAQAPLKLDTVSAKYKVASLTRKWKFSVWVQAGRSSPAPSLGSAAMADFASSPSTTASGGFSSTYAMPDRSNGGISYAVGIGLSRDISRRLAFSFGLQYSAYRTKSQVGTFRLLDTALRYRSATVNVGGYYRNGNQQDYTTRTSVLEVPVSIDYKVVRSLPLFVSVGGTYGRLLQSSALTFNRTANVYYENKQNLSGNQFSLFASLQYGIINKKGFALRAGPVVQYQLNAFQKEPGTAAQRLLFAGAKTSLQF